MAKGKGGGAPIGNKNASKSNLIGPAANAKSFYDNMILTKKANPFKIYKQNKKGDWK